MTTFLALLQALPKILALFQFILGKANDAEQRGLGRKEAVAEGLQIAMDDLSKADEARNAARLRHAADKTDGAFNGEFERKG